MTPIGAKPLLPVTANSTGSEVSRHEEQRLRDENLRLRELLVESMLEASSPEERHTP
jgi:hypothetical protein